MSINAESLVTDVSADTSSADQTLAQFSARSSEQLSLIEGKIDGLGSGGAGGGAGGKVEDFFGKFLTFQAVVQASQAIAGFVSGAVAAYAANERLDQSLQTLVARELRNADATLSMGEALDQAGPKAAELLKWNEQLAINSPFDEAGIAAAFRTAEGYGFVSESADKTAISAKRLTQDLVDFAAGSGRTSETVNQVALALGQIEAKGKVAGQEVLQLVNAGIPVDQILAKAFNKTTAEIVALREQGMIPADQAVKAIAYSLENDFGGAAKRQSGTMSGLLNSLSDLQTIGSRDLLGPAIKDVQPILQQLVDTLNSPEGKANIEAIGAAVGELTKSQLPLLIHDFSDMAGSIKDAYTDVMLLVDGYNQIKGSIPSGREIGEQMGFGPLHQFVDALRSGDIVGYLGQMTGATTQTAQAATALNAAHRDGGGGTWGDDISDAAYAQSSLALSTQASTEQLTKYQTELDKTGVTGQAAYEKLASSQAQFAEAEQQRAGDHQARLSSIDQAALDQRATATQNYRDSDADRQSSYQERQRSTLETAARAETDALATEQDRQSAATEQQQSKIADLHTRASDLQAARQTTDAAREQDYQARRVDLASQAAQQLADTQTREHDRQASAEQSYQDRIGQLVQRGVDLQIQAAASLADRQQQYAQRTADLQSNAADTQQTNDEQFQEDKTTRAGDHSDRMNDLQAQLSAATDAKQRASIEKQLDAENERYAKQEAKAQTSYDRQAEKAEKALAKQLEQAAQSQARAEQQAADQLAKQQTALAAQQAAQDTAYAASEGKAQAAYARQLATADSATASQLAKLQESHAKQIASDETRYQSDVASLQKAFNAEIDGYNRSEAKQAQHLATERGQRQAALLQQLTDTQTAFDSGELKAQTAFDKQQKAADTAHARQIAGENTSFARQESTAQASFDKQQGALDIALGKQLLAYTDTQVKMSVITAQEADKRHALIAKEFGVDPAAAQGQFAAYLAQLSNPSGITPSVGGAGERGAGLAFSGPITINLQAVSDPAANAAAIQAQLLQLQNRNGSTGIH